MPQVIRKSARTTRATVSRESRPVAVKVCSTRFVDSKTRRYVSAPKDGAAPVLRARVHDARYLAGDRATLTITERADDGTRRVRSVKVRDTAARNAARALPGKVARRKALRKVSQTERDLSLLELEARGGSVAADDHAASMRAAYQDDQTRRAKVSRKRNATARAASGRKIDPDRLRAQLLQAQRIETENRSRALRAKTDQTRAAYTRRARAASDRVAKLQGQLKRAGVKA